MKPKRAYIYTRVSDEPKKNKKKKDEEPTSRQNPENQEARLKKVAELKGYDVVKIITDRISSQRDPEKRPGFKKLKEAIEQGQLDTLLVWNVDRIARSTGELAFFLQFLHQNNVDIYIELQPIDTTTPYGKAMFQIAAVFAELERSLISERIKLALAERRGRGVRLGRPPRESKDRGFPARVLALHNQKLGIQEIATRLKCGTHAVMRILKNEKKYRKAQ